jgi:hypothetical protein
METNVPTTPEKIGHCARVIASADYGKMREIAKAVYENPALLEDFKRDPEGTAHRINGFVAPEGFHIHIADADNKFYPPEDPGIFGAEGRDQWDRMEMRAGYRTFSLVGCF